ncbi:hypothetical protein JQ557_26810 [Bradyrhizobium sp. U87765 SZCCT0131]|uniref:hypothetical protein n=1 Tax=unclassified Bradyrhizobium TaxID=2631580 RepID=UPI001BA948E5|nr:MULTISPECIES: hypothetical protein [unclassified Bradyrhizobium]MBR1221640.1 hypothetical protein [Bradyrhizobium sp. U87765 SZCCT0131]MBR1264437.1 hypothetical protein [Bradyrhizobium sp. U87765 SZCCT0134]MBR1304656.1 hypothetical protein [Bradyrhizobium sp. U87765 SZCCT0110]MBR1322487.1 hypothetical protein [Bradyrhizobium sp. U87765 SZCCT0109]MBR1346585.1 hypothetical protein [Bradyrhizobium sp. U87765 SZCCT0048]
MHLRNGKPAWLTKLIGAALTITGLSVGMAFAADIDAPTKAPKSVLDVPWFIVNDNRLTYAYAFTATEPGAASRTAKQVFAFTHFDVWAYGTNFVELEMLKSDSRDPASPCLGTVGVPNACAGTAEFYGLFRSTFGWNQIFDTKAFTIGPLSNISFVIGADTEVENQFLAPNKKDIVAGLQFAFDLPYKGYFNVSPVYYQEWNHNAFLMPGFMPAGFTGLPDGNTRFHPTWSVELNYYMDLGFLPESMQYFAVSGRASFRGSKGDGSYGGLTVPSSNNTRMEINSEPVRLTFDASKLLWGKKYSHFVDVWVAYLYWHNKFGLDDSNPAVGACFFANGVNNKSCTEKSLYSGISVKF